MIKKLLLSTIVIVMMLFSVPMMAFADRHDSHQGSHYNNHENQEHEHSYRGHEDQEHEHSNRGHEDQEHEHDDDEDTVVGGGVVCPPGTVFSPVLGVCV